MSAISRASVAAAVDRTGMARAVLSVRRAVSPWIPVLTYHRVARRDDASLFDDGVVDVSPEQLHRQLAFLRQWFTPIGTDDLVAFVNGSGRLPRNPVMVTFDDGYLDNHDVALPILLEHGVRATFFIATDYVERRRMYWWDRVNFVIKTSTRERLSLAYPEREVIALEGPDGSAGPDGRERRLAAVRRVQRTIKDRVGLDLERFLEGLERAAGVVLSAEDERAMADATVMTWKHVAALRRAGMDVQSHSHTHRVLDTLSAPALEHELRASRSALEGVLGERVRAISYPVGRSLGDSAPMRRAVREAGYELGFSNATGTNRRRAFDPLDVRRISLESDMGDRFFRSMLAIPWLSY